MMFLSETEVSKSKLWIVTELFYPDQTSTAYIMSKIANRMSEKYDVNVITTDSLYQENISNSDKYFNLDESISVIRVKSKRLNKNSLIQRFIRLFTQSNSLFRELKNRVSSNEKVLIVTNPAPLIVKCAKLKKRRNFYLNILVHDVFLKTRFLQVLSHQRNHCCLRLSLKGTIKLMQLLTSLSC